MECTKWDRLGFCVIEKLELGDRVDGISDPGRRVNPVPATSRKCRRIGDRKM